MGDGAPHRHQAAPGAQLQASLDWLARYLAIRLAAYFSAQAEDLTAPLIPHAGDTDWLKPHLHGNTPGQDELAIIMLSLAPYLQPGLLGRCVAEHLPEGGDFPDFGGIRSANHRGILPTGETAQFLLAGNSLERRLRVLTFFDSAHWLAQNHILWLADVPEGTPRMSGQIILASDFIERLTTGRISRPRFSSTFPAEYIHTDLSWDDLVLNSRTAEQIQEISRWLLHNDTLVHDWGMQPKLKPGFRALFCGPPGTGKTQTATLLGKQIGHDVFRIDLSRVVSKYIGETEKNLAHLFDQAEHKQWVLFFDEADALFGKRTDIRDAHDKYANQEVAYLLQRIESYHGIVILATNQRGNIDEAFVRRFQTVVNFPMPGPDERHAIWSRTFPGQIELADDVNWQEIAQRYELSGAGILNVTHYLGLEVLAGGKRPLSLQQLETAIQREFMKDGKIV